MFIEVSFIGYFANPEREILVLSFVDVYIFPILKLLYRHFRIKIIN